MSYFQGVHDLGVPLYSFYGGGGGGGGGGGDSLDSEMFI